METETEMVVVAAAAAVTVHTLRADVKRKSGSQSNARQSNAYKHS